MRIDPPIYLDDHATTPLDPRVLAAMLPWLGAGVGNAGSTHVHGRRAAAAVEQARALVADLVAPGEPVRVVFTSGATEACALALRGSVEALRVPGSPVLPHLITSAIEHDAVGATARDLVRRGSATLTVLPVDARGLVDPAAVLSAVRPSTALVAVMAANNEIGTVEPLGAILEGLDQLNARAGRAFPVRLLADAVQALGRVPLAPADLVTVSGHKLYGPQGIGALVVRGELALRPQQLGGGQEGGLRSGTVPVALAVGLGEAARLMALEGDEDARRVGALRDGLAERILGALGARVRVNGPWGGETHEALRLPGNLNLSFPGVCAAKLAARLSPLVSLSSGSACHAASAGDSPVIRAIGGLPPSAGATVRFGLGRFTRAEEVAIVAEALVAAVRAQVGP